MGKTIIVAGAGHGGIAAAAGLAQKGFDVTVIEKNPRNKLGYDWTDIFAPNALLAANIPYPSKEKYEYKENMTFFSPSKKVGLKQDVPKNELEIKMERSDIYDHLITHAEKCGVKFRYETEIIAPVMLGGRVAGVKTADEVLYCDLVIDAAGLDSPLRSQLPSFCSVENKVNDCEQFYVYRAFYNRVGDFQPNDNYQVYILHGGQRRIVWLATENDYTDVLIGRFEPLCQKEVDEVLAELRSDNPHLGENVVSGGKFVKIPVRQPLSVFVADGYAAIGDSAFMTVPIIGSGIANSLKASDMLVTAIDNDKDCRFTADSLWKYQTDYYKSLGSGFAAMAVLKLFLLKLAPSELDFLFEKGILTAKEFTIGANTTNLQSMLKLSAKDIIDRAKALCTDKILLTKIVKLGSQIAAAFAIASMLPHTYSRSSVAKWSDTYVRFYQKLEK